MPKIQGVSAQATKDARAMLTRNLTPPENAKKTTDKDGGDWFRWTERISLETLTAEDAKKEGDTTTVFYVMGKVLPQPGQGPGSGNIGKMAHLRVRVNFDDLYGDDDKARARAIRGVGVLESLLLSARVDLPPEGGIPVAVLTALFPQKGQERSQLAGKRVVASLVQSPPGPGYDNPFVNVDRFAPDMVDADLPF